MSDATIENVIKELENEIDYNRKMLLSLTSEVSSVQREADLSVASGDMSNATNSAGNLAGMCAAMATRAEAVRSLSYALRLVKEAAEVSKISNDTAKRVAQNAVAMILEKLKARGNNVGGLVLDEYAAALKELGFWP